MDSIKELLGFISIFFTAFVLFTNGILWLEIKASQTDSASTYRYESPAIIILLKTMLMEWLILHLRLLLFPLRWFKFKEIHNNKNIPILLIHGYLEASSDWAYFKYILEQDKEIGPVYTANLSPTFASIATIAQGLNDKIEEILQLSEHKQLILVGHSMGGVVASYYSEYLDKNHYIKKVINLAAPLQGSKLSAFALGANGKEMLYKSSFTEELVAKIKHSKKPYHFCVSQYDNIIIPWNSAVVAKAKAEPYLAQCSHLEFLFHKDIIAQVAKWCKE